MRMAKALVIVLVIDGVSIFSDELECDSPATAHPNRPSAFPITLHGVKP